MKTKTINFKFAVTVLIIIFGIALFLLALHGVTWAPYLLSSVSWNA